MREKRGDPLGPVIARYLPESGYSTISGRVLGADREVLERRVRGVDDLVRVVGPGGQEGDVAGLQLEHLAGDAQGAATFEDHERLFLGVMEVVRAAAHAGRDDVDAHAERLRRGAARQARAHRVVERRAQLALLGKIVEVADQLLAKSLGKFAHGPARFS